MERNDNWKKKEKRRRTVKKDGKKEMLRFWWIQVNFTKILFAEKWKNQCTDREIIEEQPVIVSITAKTTTIFSEFGKLYVTCKNLDVKYLNFS